MPGFLYRSGGNRISEFFLVQLAVSVYSPAGRVRPDHIGPISQLGLREAVHDD
jgi:hypothetical protein